jgi:glycosyltransferase involved in cell wall biosynthesis
MLVQMGHNIHLAFSREGPDKPNLKGVFLHKLKSRSNYDPYLLWQVYFLIRKIKPDIVHTWIMQMDILGGIAAYLNRVPWLFREPNSAKRYSKSWKQFLRIKLCSTASGAVSNSLGGNEYWKSYIPLSRRFIIKNGIPFSLISKTKPKLPFPLFEIKGPIIIFVGRLDAPQKNLSAFLKVMSIVFKQKLITVIVCGEGNKRHFFERLSIKLGLKDSIHFIGYLPSTTLWATMKKATLFVSISKVEGSPNAVLEAITCGCPTVLSDIPAHREILDDGNTIFVDPSNIQDTAEVILNLLRDPNKLEQIAKSANKSISSYLISRMAKNYETLYRQLR